MTSQGDAEWALADINKKIVGATIVGTIATPDNESYGLQVMTPEGKTLSCWIDCDPEGNGPGFMKIEDA